MQEQLEDSQTGKEHFETQYRSLLGRVNGIKASLGDRLKADAVCGAVQCHFMNLELV